MMNGDSRMTYVLGCLSFEVFPSSEGALVHTPCAKVLALEFP